MTGLRLDSNAVGTWDTDSATPYWVLAVATTLDGPVLNALETMAVNLAVADGDSFVLFASDHLGTEFVVGNTLTLTVTFADGSTATGGDYSALARTMLESVFLGVRLPSP